jgi:hypothetical protein
MGADAPERRLIGTAAAVLSFLIIGLDICLFLPKQFKNQPPNEL